jgi:thiol-disulfide isomerase/thioredoxin
MKLFKLVFGAALLALLVFWLVGGVFHGGVAADAQGQLVVLDVPAPELVGEASDWINTGGEAVEFIPGAVYVVHFWTFGCINCKRNLPAYARWQKKYLGKPLGMVGVHTPEMEKEKDPANVAEAIREHQIAYPVLLDTEKKNWRGWKQQWWPTVYLVDKRGHVRFYWKGELEWEKAGGTRIMEYYIDMLLRETYTEPVR